MWRGLVVGCLALCSAGRFSAGTVEKSDDPLVVLYYEEWSEWLRGFHVSQLDQVILSRKLPVRNWVINLAFVTWSHEECRIAPTDEQAAWSKGDPAMGGTSWFEIHTEWGSPAGSMAGLMALRQKYPSIKILPSVGGWSASHTFSDCVHSRPDIMVESAIDFVRHFHFDGIDLDWEYPECPANGSNDGSATCGCQKEPTCPRSSNRARKGDWEAYKSFLTKLRAGFDNLENELQKRLYITAAIGMSPKHIKGESPWVAPLPVEWICDTDYFDWVNLMTYDFYGPWTQKTGHLAPLYPTTQDPDADKEQISVAESLNLIMARCSRPEKLMMGLATYGKNWANVPANGRIPGLWQMSQNEHLDVVKSDMTWGANGTWEAGTISYWDINNNYLKSSGCERTWDDVAKVPTIHCKTNPNPTQLFPDWKSDTFISYEDGESWAAKMEFARQKGMGGAIIWAASDMGDTKTARDSVEQLYGGLFKGWSGKNINIQPMATTNPYKYKFPTMQELIQKGFSNRDFPCPYPVSADANGVLKYDWKSNVRQPNPCYPNDSGSYRNKPTYPLYEGSGVQDVVGQNVILISSGKPTAKPDPIAPTPTSDVQTPPTVNPPTPSRPTRPPPPDLWSVASCEAHGFPFDAVAPGVCAKFCPDAKANLDSKPDYCSGSNSLGACLQKIMAACDSDPAEWTVEACENYPFPEYFYAATCRGQCKEYIADPKWLNSCRQHRSAGDCVASIVAPCKDFDMDVNACRREVPKKDFCQAKCVEYTDSREGMTTCRSAGHKKISDCVVNLHQNECGSGSSSGDSSNTMIEECKKADWPVFYQDYCGTMCEFFGHPEIYQEECTSYASLEECVKADDQVCVHQVTTPKPDMDLTEPRWQFGVCWSEYQGHPFQDICQAWCKYWACPQLIHQCYTHGSLSECVRSSTNYSC